MKKLVKIIVSLVIASSILASPLVANADEVDVAIGIGVGEITVQTRQAATSLSELSQGSPEDVISDSDYSVSAKKVNPTALQIVIKLETPDAKSRYQFQFSGVKDIQATSQNGTTVYQLIGQNDSTLGWLSSPWAKDANGRSVNTHYEFEGGQVIQVIDTADPQIVYPVTADHFLFIDLISSVNISYQGITRNIQVAVSPWMGVQYVGIIALPWGYTAAVEVAQSYGWQEVLDKIEAKYGITARNFITTKATYENQWDCHALGAPAIFGATAIGKDHSPTWDLEGYRAATTNLATWINTRCNW